MISENQSPSFFSGDRVVGLDLLRGIALLGILLANVHQMLSSWNLAGVPVAIVPGEWGTYIEWFFVSTLVDNKFLTIFSLLFGVGFAIQVSSLKSKTGGFRIIYARRLLLLALIGIGHALFLYTADVLFYYAVTGVVLMLFWGLSARVLMVLGFGLSISVMYWYYFLEVAGSQDLAFALPIIAGIIIALLLIQKLKPVLVGAAGVLLLVGAVAFTNAHKTTVENEPGLWGYMQMAAEGLAAMPDDAIVIGGQQFEVPLDEDALAQIAEMELGPADQMALETTAMRDGPAAFAVETRADRFLGMLVAFVLFYFWRTLGIFLFGAGLVKWGLLNRGSSPLYRKAAMWGIGVGLPLSALGTALVAAGEPQTTALMAWAGALQEFAAYPLAAGIAGLVMLWSASQRFARIQRSIAAAGRMALTNYIGQSAIMALLATSYGAGLFGTVSRMEQLGLALVVFTGLVVVSRIWLSIFHMGPLEWFWRLGTYFKMPPVFARRSKAKAGA